MTTGMRLLTAARGLAAMRLAFCVVAVGAVVLCTADLCAAPGVRPKTETASSGFVLLWTWSKCMSF